MRNFFSVVHLIAVSAAEFAPPASLLMIELLLFLLSRNIFELIYVSDGRKNVVNIPNDGLDSYGTSSEISSNCR